MSAVRLSQLFALAALLVAGPLAAAAAPPSSDASVDAVVAAADAPHGSRDEVKALPVRPTPERDFMAVVESVVPNDGCAAYFTSAGQPFQAGQIDDSHDDAALHAFARAHLRPSLDSSRDEALAARTEVFVTDASGRPLADAIVEVRSVKQPELRPLVTLRAGTDGRVIISNRDFSLDADRRGPRVRIEAQDRGGHSVASTARLGRGPVELRVDLDREAAAAAVLGLDLVLVVDDSGRMHEAVAWLDQHLMTTLAGVLLDHPTPMDVRLGVVSYREQGLGNHVRAFALTADRVAFEAELERIHADQPGTAGRGTLALHEALRAAAELDWRHDQQVAKVMLVIGDAPSRGLESAAAKLQVMQLRRAGVSIYPIAPADIDDGGQAVLRTFAADSGAQYFYLIGPDSPHTRHHGPHSVLDHNGDLWRLLGEALAAELDSTWAPIPTRPTEAAFALEHSLIDDAGLARLEGRPSFHLDL